LGYVIKHIAAAQIAGDAIGLRVGPVLLPATHQLASIREENNAVLVRGDAVGEMLFSGKGAGSLPSASAVLSDIVDIACHKGGFSSTPGISLNAHAMDQSGQHYLRFPVTDPSIIGPITSTLERNGVGVARAAAVWGKNGSVHHHVRVLTHACTRAKVEGAVRNVSEQVQAAEHPVLLSVAE
jgi:homoserine dehydrogenase